MASRRLRGGSVPSVLPSSLVHSLLARPRNGAPDRNFNRNKNSDGNAEAPANGRSPRSSVSSELSPRIPTHLYERFRRHNSSISSRSSRQGKSSDRPSRSPRPKHRKAKRRHSPSRSSSSSHSGSSTSSSSSSGPTSSDSSDSRHARHRKVRKHRKRSKDKIVKPKTSYGVNKAQVKFNIDLAKVLKNTARKSTGKVKKSLERCIGRINERNQVVYVTDKHGYKVGQHFNKSDHDVLTKRQAKKLRRILRDEGTSNPGPSGYQRSGGSGDVSAGRATASTASARFRDRGDDEPREFKSRQPDRDAPPGNACNYCHEEGHWKRNCRKLAEARKRGQVP